MKKILKKYFIGLIYLVLNSAAYAQPIDATGELRKMVSAYNNEESTYAMNISINYFFPYNSNTLIDTMRISTLVGKSAFYYKLRGMELICHDGYYLQVDNKDQQISLSQMGKNAAVANSFYGIQLIDSMVKAFNGTGTITSAGAGLNILTLYLPGSTMPEIRVTYDPKTYYVKKSVLKYVEDVNLSTVKPASFARVEIIYNSIKKTNSPFPASKYPFSKYVNLKGKETTLTVAYRNYKLSNFLK